MFLNRSSLEPPEPRALLCGLIFLLPLLSLDPVAAQELDWARRVGGIAFDRASAVAVDGLGNVHTVGYIQGPVDLDPGPGVFQVTDQSGDFVTGTFLQDLDADGSFVAGYTPGGLDVAADAEGNVIQVGYFARAYDFDPGPGVFNLAPVGPFGGFDVFVRKFDAAGNFLWARAVGGSGEDIARAVAVDASGSVVVAGLYEETADFDPGAGVFNLSSAGGEDIFVLRLDAAGNFVWAGSMGGPMRDIAFGVALDASGDAVLVGSFCGEADFDPGASSLLLVPDGCDAFVSRLSPAGLLLWARAAGGERGLSVAVDGGGITTAGRFVASGGGEAFVLRLDHDGNSVWDLPLGAEGINDEVLGVALGGNEVVVAGSFQGTVDFDRGPGSFSLTSQGGQDAFVARYDSAGRFLGAVAFGGPDHDAATDVALDAAGGIHVVGGFFSPVMDFDPGPGTFNLASAGFEDVFVAKLQPVAAADIIAIPTATEAALVTMALLLSITGVLVLRRSC